jgi:hypothetical protein
MAKKDESKEDDLIAVGPGSDTAGTIEDTPAKRATDAEATQEDRDDADEHEEGDERLAGAAQSDDDEVRSSRRDERKRRKLRQKENRDRNFLELDFLRQRNEELERRQTSQIATLETRVAGTEVATVDQRISEIRQKLETANQVMAACVSSNDPNRGQDFMQAQGIRDQLVQALTTLDNFKRGLVSRSAQAEQEETQSQARRAEEAPAPKLSKVHKERATEWFRANPWFKNDGSDPDSKRILTIDSGLAAEGLDPTTHEYWDEFEKRVTKAVPRSVSTLDIDGNTYEDDEDEFETPARKRVNGGGANGGPRLTVGGRERPLRKGEVYIDPERRKALEDAGVWDDPVLRNRFLKRYAQWDRDNPRANARQH